MGRKPTQTFSQSHTDGQHAHEKMLNITSYQRNANQNYNEAHWSEWPSSKSLQTTNAGEGVEKKGLSYTAGGNVNWCSTMENSMEVPQKTKNRISI